MKSIFTILFFVFIPGITQAQIVNIPDSNFKTRLLQAGPSNLIAQDIYNNYVVVDTNSNGEIEVSEALNISRLRLDSQNISDLTGIEAFTNLVGLACFSNNISQLDISQNINLNNLNIGSNLLTSLDISQNQNLERLFCNNNQLSDIDISNNLDLFFLDCSANQLVGVDFSQNLNLTNLNLRNNQIAELDVSHLSELSTLRCQNNLLTELDVSQNVQLETFECQNNLLTTLDVSQNPKIDLGSPFNCSNNLLTTLYIKNGGYAGVMANFLPNPNLTYICANEYELEYLSALLEYNDLDDTISLNSYCSFMPNGEFNTITGVMTFDSDNNSCDDSDYEIPNLRLSLDDGTSLSTTFSNQSGEYTFYTEIGDFQLTPEFENPSFFNITPLSVDVDFTDLNNTVNQDFCISPNGVHNDVEVVIAPAVPAQPGFGAVYRLVYKNKGSQIITGSMDFTYDESDLDYLSATETPSIQDFGNLAWDYVNLNPFETRVIHVFFNVNSPMDTPAVNIDDILNFTATINPVAADENPDDNIFTLDQVVVGSYDPNDITCLEGDIVSPDKIGEYLHYNIRFENTGTAPATFVVVRDDINEAQYDLGSLQVLNSSHDMYTRITGNRVEFIFDDINLAPEEIGNILFKIKSLETLNTGDEVAQQAEIYFDYNFPIITNIAQTSYQALSINEFDLNDSVEIFPNPTTDFFRIISENLIQSLKVYDVHGRLVLQESLSNKETSVSLSSFKSGVYFIEVHSNSGIVIKRLIKN